MVFVDQRQGPRWLGCPDDPRGVAREETESHEAGWSSSSWQDARGRDDPEPTELVVVDPPGSDEGPALSTGYGAEYSLGRRVNPNPPMVRLDPAWSL